jgi:hypothetical protein
MIVSDIIYNILKSPETSQDFFLKYLPILSPLIVIATFIFNNRYDRRNKKKEAKRSWYFKAYFEPNIKKIEDFFTQADKKLEDGKNAYNLKIASGNSKDNNNIIAETLNELSKLKRKFSHEVLDIIKPAYPNEFNLMTNHLLDFEDAGTDVFDDVGNIIDDQKYYIYVSKLSEIKAKLIKVLSGPAL